ncbi:hypothetical protein VDGL01_02523 [Verticillium dahliae]
MSTTSCLFSSSLQNCPEKKRSIKNIGRHGHGCATPVLVCRQLGPVEPAWYLPFQVYSACSWRKVKERERRQSRRA